MKRPACRHGASLQPAHVSAAGNLWTCSGCGALTRWGPSTTWYGMIECPGCERAVVLEVRCGACPSSAAPPPPPPARRGSGVPPGPRTGRVAGAASLLARLAAAVGGRVYRWRHEDDLQRGIFDVLAGWPEPVLREAQLPGVRGRIDFLVGEVGIEVKVDGGLSPVTRQLHRYLEVEALAGVLLVTTVASHLAVPREMLGKPVTVVRLTGGLS